MPNIRLQRDNNVRLNNARTQHQASQQPVEPQEPTIEQDAQEELSEVLQGFRDRAQAENQRFVDATDSEFWVAFCFQTREQKEEFLTLLKLIELGDKYIDGMEAARKLGITLTSRVPQMPRRRPFDRDLIRLARD